MSEIKSVLPNGLAVCLDWLGFTVLDECYATYSGVLKLFGLHEKDFVQAPKGSNGYKVMYKHNAENISILCDGSEGMGIHLNISASGLNYFVSCFRETLKCASPFGECYDYAEFNTVLQVLLSKITEIGSFTRLDIACDDIGVRYYSVSDFAEICDDKSRISTRYKSYHSNISKNFDDGRTVSGNTLSLGSRDSDCYLRVYDKQLEQARKNSVSPDSLPPWVRWEFEIKGNPACSEVVKHLLGGLSLGGVFCGILKNKVRVIVPDNARKERCSTEPLWDSFLCEAEKLSISVPKSEKTLERVKNWFDRQIAPSFSALVQVSPDMIDAVDKWVENGDRRMNGSLRSLVNERLHIGGSGE